MTIPAQRKPTAVGTRTCWKTRPVTVYRLVAAGTLEEGVVAMQEQKRALFMSVLEGHEQGGAVLDEDGLMALLEGAVEARSAGGGDRGVGATPSVVPESR